MNKKHLLFLTVLSFLFVISNRLVADGIEVCYAKNKFFNAEAFVDLASSDCKKSGKILKVNECIDPFTKKKVPLTEEAICPYGTPKGIYDCWVDLDGKKKKFGSNMLCVKNLVRYSGSAKQKLPPQPKKEFVKNSGIYGSCLAMEKHGMCQEFLGLAFKRPGEAATMCSRMEGKFRQTPCSKKGLVGACHKFKNEMHEMKFYYYKSYKIPAINKGWNDIEPLSQKSFAKAACGEDGEYKKL